MSKFKIYSLAILLICGGAEVSMAQTNWTGAVNDNWFTSGNWDTGIVPNGISVDVVIDFPSPTVVNGVPNINSLNVGSNGIVNSGSFGFGGRASTTLNNAGVINVGNNSSFELSGMVNNSGFINAIDTISGSGTSNLVVQSGTATITGGGTTNLIGNNARISGAPGSAIEFANQTIQGEGDLGEDSIGITIGPNALVDANVSGLPLTLDAGDAGAINDGVLQASGGGILRLLDSDIDNTNGSIVAQANSIVELFSGAGGLSTQITGGLLSGPGNFNVFGQANFLNNITNSSTINIGNNTTLSISGTINNTGSINAIDTAGAANSSVLSVQSATSTLTGGGTVNMSGNSARISGINGTSIIFENQTIQGEGYLGDDAIGIVNAADNLVDANVSGLPLTLDAGDAGAINNGIMQASGGGILRLIDSDIDNTNGSIVAQAGSIVELAQFTGDDSMQITGGLFSGPGNFNVSYASRAIVLNNITNESTINVGNNTILNTAGTLTNSGVITLTDDVGNACASILSLGGPLKGGGTIRLSGNNARILGGTNGPVAICDVTIEGDGNFGDDSIEIDTGANTVFHANLDGLTLSIDLGTPTFISSCDLRASNGGILELVDPVINNGVVDAGPLSIVTFLDELTNEALVQGSGTIETVVLNNNGIVAPGNSAGELELIGDALFGSTAELQIELASSSSFDVLSISGNLVSLDGTLDLSLLNGFVPDPFDTFTILSTSKSAQLVGEFSNVADGARLTTSGGSGSFQVNYVDGNSSSVILTDFRLILPLPATTAAVVQGILTSGTVDDLLESDNVDVSIRRNPGQLAGVVEVELQSTTPIQNPVSFAFTIEASAFYRGQLIQSVEFFDYVAGEFVEVDSRAASPFVDSVATAIGSGGLARFVENGTGNVRTRILYTTPINRQKFAASIDQVFWAIDN